MSFSGGYIGKILRIDLSSRSFETQNLEEDLALKYLGGEGLGARILWEDLKPGIDPFDPSNELIIASGPLQGTKCPSVSRLCIVTKSPLTGGFTRTLSGGYTGYEFKRAGFDAIVIRGKSSSPVYLWIKDGSVEFRDAGFLWGMQTNDTQKYVKHYTDPGAQVMCIGPAGERLVRFACIISNIGAFGRGGSGAIMGSKRLKAIAIKGRAEVKVADPKTFEETIRKVYSSFSSKKEKAENWRRYGTTDMTDTIESHGNWPTRNWQEGIFPPASDSLYSVPWRKQVVKKDIACTICPIYCRKITSAGDYGPFSSIVSEGPEYETIWAFGAQCGNSDARLITVADRNCDEFGLDTISCGSVIGFAMELYQRGIIKEEDTDGLKLKWGNPKAIVETIRKIAEREGIGNVLAEGVKRASKVFGKGSESYAMHVKGLELPAYDPRGQFGMGLNYATANRGGDHCSGYTTFDEIFDQKRFETKGKGELVVKRQNETCARNSMIYCTFGDWGLEDFINDLLTAATGISFNKEKLDRIGERVFNLERAFNVR
ncbi:aldehyde ferredoxin oxidoreductase family protein, partial [Candidatus Bathyarchaeota archaeon]|nr:aldehyde ferredoxin oxidoreductase family protein [Candidatus Bathyarchaeota archaeon]